MNGPGARSVAVRGAGPGPEPLVRVGEQRPGPSLRHRTAYDEATAWPRLNVGNTHDHEVAA